VAPLVGPNQPVLSHRSRVVTRVTGLGFYILPRSSPCKSPGVRSDQAGASRGLDRGECRRQPLLGRPIAADCESDDYEHLAAPVRSGAIASTSSISGLEDRPDWPARTNIGVDFYNLLIPPRLPDIPDYSPSVSSGPTAWSARPSQRHVSPEISAQIDF